MAHAIEQHKALAVTFKLSLDYHFPAPKEVQTFNAMYPLDGDS